MALQTVTTTTKLTLFHSIRLACLARFARASLKMRLASLGAAYEPSQKYKVGKFILEKMMIHLEESDFGVGKPAGERQDRFRKRSMSWGEDPETIYEYEPQPKSRSRTVSNP